MELPPCWGGAAGPPLNSLDIERKIYNIIPKKGPESRGWRPAPRKKISQNEIFFLKLFVWNLILITNKKIYLRRSAIINRHPDAGGGIKELSDLVGKLCSNMRDDAGWCVEVYTANKRLSWGLFFEG